MVTKNYYIKILYEIRNQRDKTDLYKIFKTKM